MKSEISKQYTEIPTGFHSKTKQKPPIFNFKSHESSVASSQRFLRWKYFEVFNFYFAKPINEILAGIKNSMVILFKDFIFYDNIKEFMRRFYTTEESLVRLKNYTNYYQEIQKKFYPKLPLVEQSSIIHKYIVKLHRLKQKKHSDPHKTPQIVYPNPIIPKNILENEPILKEVDDTCIMQAQINKMDDDNKNNVKKISFESKEHDIYYPIYTSRSNPIESESSGILSEEDIKKHIFDDSNVPLYNVLALEDSLEFVIPTGKDEQKERKESVQKVDSNLAQGPEEEEEKKKNTNQLSESPKVSKIHSQRLSILENMNPQSNNNIDDTPKKNEPSQQNNSSSKRTIPTTATTSRVSSGYKVQRRTQQPESLIKKSQMLEQKQSRFEEPSKTSDKNETLEQNILSVNSVQFYSEHEIKINSQETSQKNWIQGQPQSSQTNINNENLIEKNKKNCDKEELQVHQQSNLPSQKNNCSDNQFVSLKIQHEKKLFGKKLEDDNKISELNNKQTKSVGLNHENAISLNNKFELNTIYNKHFLNTPEAACDIVEMDKKAGKSDQKIIHEYDNKVFFQKEDKCMHGLEKKALPAFDTKNSNINQENILPKKLTTSTLTVRLAEDYNLHHPSLKTLIEKYQSKTSTIRKKQQESAQATYQMQTSSNAVIGFINSMTQKNTILSGSNTHNTISKISNPSNIVVALNPKTISLKENKKNNLILNQNTKSTADLHSKIHITTISKSKKKDKNNNKLMTDRSTPSLYFNIMQKKNYKSFITSAHKQYSPALVYQSSNSSKFNQSQKFHSKVVLTDMDKRIPSKYGINVTLSKSESKPSFEYLSQLKVPSKINGKEFENINEFNQKVGLKLNIPKNTKKDEEIYDEPSCGFWTNRSSKDGNYNLNINHNKTIEKTSSIIKEEGKQSKTGAKIEEFSGGNLITKLRSTNKLYKISNIKDNTNGIAGPNFKIKSDKKSPSNKISDKITVVNHPQHEPLNSHGLNNISYNQNFDNLN